jgi:hypothetical protein
LIATFLLDLLIGLAAGFITGFGATGFTGRAITLGTFTTGFTGACGLFTATFGAIFVAGFLHRQFHFFAL